MDFGLCFYLQVPRPWDRDTELAAFQGALSQVELADQLGYASAWVTEQHFTEEFSHSSAPEVFLAAASQRTRSIRLGHGVVLMPPGYNHPARVAERIATLDLLSNGRVDFGIGNSKSRIELEGFGIDPAERQAMSLEAIEQVASMLAMDPFPGYTGRYFSMPARNVVPKPLQKPHPPLWMAASDNGTMHRAAQLGVGVLAHAFASPQEARDLVSDYYATMKQACVPIGHSVNPNVATLLPFYCHEDEGEALRVGRAANGFLTFAVRHYYTFGRHRPGRTSVWDTAESVSGAMGGEIPLYGGHAFGTPAQLTSLLRGYEDAGVDQVILLHQAGKTADAAVRRSLELFAAEVMPQFAARAAEREQAKRQELRPYLDAALARKASVAPPSDDDIPRVDAYGLSRPPADISGRPPEVQEQLRELDRLRVTAHRHY